MNTATQTNHNSLEARKQRWLDLQKPDAKPGFLFEVKTIENPAIPMPQRPLLRPDLVQERIDWAVRVYDYWTQRMEWLHDDFVPAVMCCTGTEVFGEALGGEVYYAEIANPCAIPFIKTAREADKIKVPELSQSSLAYLFDMAEAMQEKIGKGIPLMTPDIQSPMDVVAIMWDKSTLFLEMYDNPQAVKELAKKAEELMVRFIDEWFRRFGTCIKGPCSQGMMDQGIRMSVDEVGAVNEQMFDVFFLPELTTLSNRYGGLGIHCCADARHQWDNWKKVPNLKILNLHRPTKRTPEYCKEAYQFFAETCLQCHIGYQPDGPVETWLDNYPSNGRFQIEIITKTDDEAKEICDTLNQIRGTV